MKEWMLLGLAGIGAYAVYQWWCKNRASAAGQNAANAAGSNTGLLSRLTGSGDFSGSPLQSGIPVFNGAPIANGHGDQVVAAQHSSPMTTIPGSPDYMPAFGPDENRGGLQVW